MSFLTQRFGLTRFEADEYYAQALEYYEKDDLKEALDKIDLALALLPQNPEYHAARGLFCWQHGMKDKAKADFEKALALNEGEVLANYGMGMVAFDTKAWDDAILYFNRARAVNPTQIEIPYYLALVYHRQQDNRTALTYMQQAQQLMEAAGDKRRTDARRWIREFEKLVKQHEKIEDEIPVQSELPLTGNLSISRQELEAARAAGELEAGDEDDTAGDE